MSSEQETLDELKAYRGKVYDEVVRRAELVKRMATDLAAADFLVGGVGRDASPPHVTAAQLQRREAMKATMKKRHAELASKHRQALDDLRSAEERLVEVDEQIRAAESRNDAGSTIVGEE